MKKVFALFLFLFCLVPKTVYSARSIYIISDKGSLYGDESLTMSASPSGFTNGESIYLKAAFFQDGGTNYFGYTKNGDSWVKNSVTALSQKQVQIGNWDGNIVLKSDFSDKGYVVKGQYSLKLGFYYLKSGGNVSSVNWSTNNIIVNLDQPESVIVTPPPEIKNTLSVSVAKITSVKISPTLSASLAVAKNVNIINTTQKDNNFAKIAESGQRTASNYAMIKSTIENKNI